MIEFRMGVRGVDGLRVCDLSALPNINAGNTSAPAMMLGSRCAEFVMGKGVPAETPWTARRFQSGEASASA